MLLSGTPTGKYKLSDQGHGHIWISGLSVELSISLISRKRLLTTFTELSTANHVVEAHVEAPIVFEDYYHVNIVSTSRE